MLNPIELDLIKISVDIPIPISEIFSDEMIFFTICSETTL